MAQIDQTIKIDVSEVEALSEKCLRIKIASMFMAQNCMKYDNFKDAAHHAVYAADALIKVLKETE